MKLTSTPKASSLLAGTATDFTATCDSTLTRAKTMVAELKALPPGSDAKVVALYDEVVTAMSNMGARSGLAKEVHPDEKFREACEKCEQQLEAFNVELSLDRGLYDALSKVETKSLDPVGAFWLFKTLREFRRSGVDRDEATRNKVKALSEELVKIGQTFGRNIRDDVRSVKLDPKELDGLPADWLAAHAPGAEGPSGARARRGAAPARRPAGRGSAGTREDLADLPGARGAAAQVRARPLGRDRAPARLPAGRRGRGGRPGVGPRARRLGHGPRSDPRPAGAAPGDRLAVRARPRRWRTST